MSRGGRKLDGALDRFGFDVSGMRGVDVVHPRASTDCLLQRGAPSVVAVDVGYGQLHEKLVADPRGVVVIDRTNVRDLETEAIGGVVDLVVADLSFISLTKVTDALLRVCRPGGELVLRREAAVRGGPARGRPRWRRDP